MNYCLFKLHFKTALHIGSNIGVISLPSSEMQIHSDTLFSVLCAEALQLGGHSKLNRLYEYVRDDKLCFSDALPFSGSELYVPKPIIAPARDICAGACDNMADGNKNDDRAKKMKKLIYLPVTCVESYMAYLKGEITDTEWEIPEIVQFGITSARTMAAIRGRKETTPFEAGIFEFLPGCGLYIIAACESEEQLEFLKRLLRMLSLSGIGGKRSAGLGKFELEGEIRLNVSHNDTSDCLSSLLGRDDDASWFMTLNVSLPAEEEMENVLKDGFYSLVRRGGFVQSQSYSSTPLKKREMYLLSPGSCLKRRFKGFIADVSAGGTHPVYRMAKPLFMGVGTWS